MIKLNTDETTLLYYLAQKAKHRFAEDCDYHQMTFDCLTDLEKKLEQKHEDKRRCGRASFDTFNDVIKRLHKKINKL